MNQLITSRESVQIVTSTMKLVDALLRMNTRNRKVNPSHIKTLSEDLQDDKFLLTGASVVVSSCGVLIDGQHRLMAIRDAGYPPVKFVLLTGAPLESQMVYDRHNRRNLAAALTLHMNITVSTRMVALVQALHAHSLAQNKDTKFTVGRKQLTDSQVALFLAEDSELIHSVVSECSELRAPISAAIYVYCKHDKDLGFEFARQVSKGLNLNDTSPAYRLRNAIDRFRKSNGAQARSELVQLTVTAIVNHAKGKSCSMLKRSESWVEAPFKWSI